MNDDSVPLKYQALFRRVRAEKSKSKADAVKAMCLECVGFKYKRVADCAATRCPLHNVRPYRKKSPNE